MPLTRTVQRSKCAWLEQAVALRGAVVSGGSMRIDLDGWSGRRTSLAIRRPWRPGPTVLRPAKWSVRKIVDRPQAMWCKGDERRCVCGQLPKDRFKSTDDSAFVGAQGRFENGEKNLCEGRVLCSHIPHSSLPPSLDCRIHSECHRNYRQPIEAARQGPRRKTQSGQLSHPSHRIGRSYTDMNVRICSRS